MYDTDCIIEFGGGFGSMCRLVHALGFRGQHIIFDLPPVWALQRYYLRLHGIEVDDSGNCQYLALFGSGQHYGSGGWNGGRPRVAYVDLDAE
jgi:hypothetical protein